MRRILFITGLVGLSAVSLTSAAFAAVGNRSSGDGASEASYTRAHRSEAATTESSARSAATGRHAGAVVDTHLQNEGGLVWELVIADNGNRWEVQVDAQSGRVVSDQRDE